MKEKCSLALHYTTHYTQLNATQTPADHRLSTYVIVQRYRIIYKFFRDNTAFEWMGYIVQVLYLFCERKKYWLWLQIDWCLLQWCLWCGYLKTPSKHMVHRLTVHSCDLGGGASVWVSIVQVYRRCRFNKTIDADSDYFDLIIRAKLSSNWKLSLEMNETKFRLNKNQKVHSAQLHLTFLTSFRSYHGKKFVSQL